VKTQKLYNKKKDFIIKPKTILKFNLIFIFILFLFHSSFLFEFRFNNTNDVSIYGRFFLFDYENNLPTFYSSIAIAISSVLTFFISLIKEIKKQEKPFWISLSIIFGILCIDEWKMIHEKINNTAFVYINQKLNIPVSIGSAWTYLYIIFAVMFCISFSLFTFKLPKDIKKLFILSFLIYVFGGLGMELFAFEVLKIDTQQNNLYLILHTLEELFEMIGISIFNFSLLKYILKYKKIVLENG